LISAVLGVFNIARSLAHIRSVSLCPVAVHSSERNETLCTMQTIEWPSGQWMVSVLYGRRDNSMAAMTCQR